MKYLLSFFCLLAFAGTALAQDEDNKNLYIGKKADSTERKTATTLSITSNGIRIEKHDSVKRPEKKFQLHVGMVDLGFNRIDDKTNYSQSTPELTQFLGYDPAQTGQKPEVLPLREGKSINVNVWPLMTKYRLINGKTQRMYLVSGIGLQMYNFRWESTKNYTDEPNTHLQSYDELHIQKNKLGLTYLSIPLELQFTTKIAPKATLVYGFGITGGYRLASWTKIKSQEHGKQKNHDDFNFRDFNSCIMGEIGLKGIIRLYGTYQLTSMHENALDQHPFSIGVRFLGI